MEQNQTLNIASGRRGCGLRKGGGVYAECRLGKGGNPIEDYLMDPPQVVNAQALGLSSVGVHLIEVEGTWHIFDIVGAEHYPNVADYIEETRYMGASRRLSRTLDFSKITPASKLVLLHRRGSVANFADYYAAIRASFGSQLAVDAGLESHWHCPKALPQHAWQTAPPTSMCAGLYWCDVENGEALSANSQQSGPRAGLTCTGRDSILQPVVRNLPSLSYTAWARPDDITANYQLAIFMVLPITDLVIIRSARANHGATETRARQSSLKVEVCDA